MALFPDPFDALVGLQQALETFRTSDWLRSGPSAGGAYPPLNVFRKGDDFVLITELPGVRKSELDIQVNRNTIRLSGRKEVRFPEKASVHRHERLEGRFDRAVTLPIEIDAEAVKAEYKNGILGLLLQRAVRDKPKSIKIN